LADELEAITLEEEDPLDHVGEEADAPADIGREAADADLDPPDEHGFAEESSPEVESRRSWRVAASLLALRREINARWPNRDRRTDGTIGDANHCGPGKRSDHCPNSAGVVRALDVDVDGIPAGWLAEHVRRRGADGDRRLANGGYVIFNRRVASWSYDWRWRIYNGASPHTDHIHISVSLDASGYDASGAWGVRTAKDTPRPDGDTPGELPEHPLGSRVLRLTDPRMRGTDVAYVQRWVGADNDGVFGPKTEERVVRFQRIVQLEPDGIVGPATWRAMRVS